MAYFLQNEEPSERYINMLDKYIMEMVNKVCIIQTITPVLAGWNDKMLGYVVAYDQNNNSKVVSTSDYEAKKDEYKKKYIILDRFFPRNSNGEIDYLLSFSRKILYILTHNGFKDARIIKIEPAGRIGRICYNVSNPQKDNVVLYIEYFEGKLFTYFHSKENIKEEIRGNYQIGFWKKAGFGQVTFTITNINKK